MSYPPDIDDSATRLADPLENLTKICDQMQRRLSGAKQRGDRREAQHLRKLLQQTKKILEDYGTDR